jgi:glycerophosphoryl diester phosphodiesterase
MAEGADGIELDVELTADGALIVMHDDTLDRTTTCTGCVSHRTLAEIQECRLLDGEGTPTTEQPPTLDEVFAILPEEALVNVELKVFGAACMTAESSAEDLAAASIDEVRALGVEDRVLYSSFSIDAAGAIKREAPDLYSAFLILVLDEAMLERAVQLGLDAIHPFLVVETATVEAILARGLQVNVWTVNGEALMRETLAKGVTSIITDEPGLLREVISTFSPSID